MRGEELEEAFVGFSGVYGDRLFAFKSSAAPKGFPYLTGREQEEMLLYRPRFRHPERAAKPRDNRRHNRPRGIAQFHRVECVLVDEPLTLRERIDSYISRSSVPTT